MTHFDASTPAPSQADREPLSRLQSEWAARDLRRALSTIDELVADEDDREAGEEMDPEIVSLLEQISGRDDGPLAFRSLHDRVRNGVLSWADYWARPQEQPGGMNLFHAVLRAQLAHDAELAREEPEG